ncbi:MAG: penicillin-binding transpeptidase domain-containing protein [Lachnospiraceae bacterium]|nr:penicillin-binding transpeptidase domain-containing protein [Lachnospiraceae bacterium]
MAKKIKKLFRKIGDNRTGILVVVFIGMFAVLIGRLFMLQVVHGEEYADNFEVQITKTRTLKSTRGNIYDRNGKLIAGNRVSYSVTLEDNGTYSSTKERVLSLNSEIYRLCKLIHANGDSIDQDTFQIEVDENGEYAFTGSEGTNRNRFRADVYGRKLIDDMEENERNSSADTIIEFLSGPDLSGLDAYSTNESYAYTEADFQKYGLPYRIDESGKAVLDLTKQERLEIIIIRYQMKKTSFQKYVGVTVASDVSESTIAAIAENEDTLQGVSITEDSERVYYDGVYFSSLIGYTGKPSSEELESLNAQLSEEGKDETYSSDSIIGKAGLEQYLETTLQGTDGSEEIIVNNVGKELQKVEGSRVDPSQGGNVYLSIDYDLQIAVYKILEQKIAGILKANLTTAKTINKQEIQDNTSVPIPIYDVYNALIENSTIDISHFYSEDATENEQKVYELFLQKKQSVLSAIEEELTGENPTVYKELDSEMQEYESYIINTLLGSNMGILSSASIDKQDDVYKAWATEETISMKEYLMYAASQNWIDVSALSTDDAYMDSSEVYQKLCEVILQRLENNTTFHKKLYHYMLLEDIIDGYDICNLMYDQDLLTKGDSDYADYIAGNMTPFELMSAKIGKLEITPAQLALDPCSGSAVITDPDSGEILACVSYSGYDNNRLANQMDTAYWAKLNTDESTPLYNKATQQRTAPGSTFKPVMAVAGLMEGVITEDTVINCNGLFGEGLVNESDHVHCWNLDGHGDLDVIGGIQNSCNVFFCTVGYLLGLDDNNTFTQKRAMEKIQEYCSLFCLDQKSGIEISEAEPKVSDELPIPSSIGQGTHNYTTTQLARYVTTLANRGTVYDISLLKKAEDSEGNEIDMGEDFGPSVNTVMNVSDSIWDDIHQGMRNVIRYENSSIFPSDWPVELYGKTGTAQEDRTRSNHGLFIGFSHYESRDDIAMAIRIPFGYSSINAELVAKDILDYYYDLSDSVLTGTADTEGVTSERAD